MKTQYIFFVLSIVSLISCRETHYNYICTGLGDSSPTELLIVNNTAQEIDLTLSVNEGTIKEIKAFKLKLGEEEEICIENEGDILNGLYFIYNGQQTMVKLKSQRLNTFNLKESTLEN